MHLSIHRVSKVTERNEKMDGTLYFKDIYIETEDGEKFSITLFSTSLLPIKEHSEET